MDITLNGEARRTSAATLADLLIEQGLTAKVATAVNGTFVPASLRATTEIGQGDRIEALSAMQGG
ncbi:sulfur carrier protein ThiS [Pseudogemmobacter bohemicus]|uniref:sulfur carrier protein ThiS n=1 Tax=Pseudogemmobacter bohemicus TaxID=2250708 RepID=UPI000DD41DD9|nr:sulfur carrier protein ThiS [Pseudogemmobacter bohemicus]